MQQRHSTFTNEGVTLDGNSHLLLNLIERDGHYSPPTADRKQLSRPPGRVVWQIHLARGQDRKPGFMYKYGYYEIRCKLQTQPGCGRRSGCIALIGSTLNPAVSGVEIDIMENLTRDGVISHNIHWNGYGDDHGYLAPATGRLPIGPTAGIISGATGPGRAMFSMWTDGKAGG